MSTNPGLEPSATLRKLPVSIPASDAAPEIALIPRVATSGDGEIVPFSKERTIAVGSAPVQILSANPRRKAVWLRATIAGSMYLVLGAKRNWPSPVDSSNRVGFYVLGQEALTIETTDEIWVMNIHPANSLTVIGTEILQSSFSK